MTKAEINERLEYLRGELRAERISYAELFELQTLASHINLGDVELLEAAGVPENEELCKMCGHPSRLHEQQGCVYTDSDGPCLCTR